MAPASDHHLMRLNDQAVPASLAEAVQILPVSDLPSPEDPADAESVFTA